MDLPALPPLPVDPFLPQVLAWLESHSNLVLTAEPGAGKTTRVPKALLGAGFAAGKEIWVLEPRRLAAQLAASRVAWELGQKAGGTAGYQFRFEKVSGPDTRLQFITEGLLLRLARNNPGLEGVAAVVLDEFHERSLDADLNLGWLKRLQQDRRPDLKLLVMSATLDADRLSAYLGDCRILRSPGRLFDVSLDYLPFEERPRLEDKVSGALHSLSAKGPLQGDVLVFLPGMREIRSCLTDLGPIASSKQWQLLPLYADLPAGEQSKVLEPSPRPKIVLSTNVAESSVTLPGVRVVIDGGLARQPRLSWWSGLSSLRTVPVSQASAIQRAGRAGRLGPGACIRLYSRYDFEHRPAFETEELQRADLSAGLLSLLSLGLEVRSFPWLDLPPEAGLEAGLRILGDLGALKEGKLTSVGKEMAGMPLPPRLARLVLGGEKSEDACHLSAMLSEEDLDDLDLWRQFRKYRPEGPARRLLDSLSKEGKGKNKASDPESLSRALLAAYPDRVGRLRRFEKGLSRGREGQAELLLAGGGTVRVGGQPPEGDYFVILEAGGSPSQPLARSLSAIQPDWLLEDTTGRLKEEETCHWNEGAERVEASRRLAYGALVLDETALEPGPEASEVLLQEAKRKGLAAFADQAKIGEMRVRMEMAAKLSGQTFLGQDDGELLGMACGGKSSFKQLRETDFEAVLLERLTPSQRGLLERLTPSNLPLPAGRRVKVHYERGKNPWVESRIQDFFGLKSSPTLAEGKVPVALHLLAPSQRPVQITSDLGGFWKNHYPKLRVELKRRYPRHRWPEDPTSA
jgi:ATP-dependent helicase HrpB